MMYKAIRTKKPPQIGHRSLIGVGIALMMIVVLLCMLPFAWMILVSFKTETAMWELPPSLKLSTFTFDNYITIWTLDKPDVKIAFFNSVFISVLVTVGSLITASLAAYAFAKLEFKGKGRLFAIIISTMMVPGQITLVPMYVLIKKIGWIDTFLPLIVPSVLTYSYGVFMLRQYFMSIPDSILESAKIDGASQPRIFAMLVLPMSMPAVASLMMLRFMGSWNSFLTPMLYINDLKKITLPLYIRYFEGAYDTKWNYMMAASCITVLPMIFIYLFTQRFLTEGIMLGGVKG